MFARRAVEHALAVPAARPPSGASELELAQLRASPPPPPADSATRDALWRHAGIERTREGLEGLLGASHPLARLIARCALARTESRGAQLRLDYPARDPALDHRHVVVTAGGETEWQEWS